MDDCLLFTASWYENETTKEIRWLRYRPEQCIVTIASLDQWLATIEKHRYQWLADWKPLKNHWSQWLSRYHSINGNGHLKNHWFFAMVVNFLPLCLAEADIKQTNDSFWKIKNIFYSVQSRPHKTLHFSKMIASFCHQNLLHFLESKLPIFYQILGKY